MTRLMALGSLPGRRGLQRDAGASGKGRNAPGGLPKTTEGRLPLTARCVAVHLWWSAPRREPRLTSRQGKTVKRVILGAPWYWDGK